MKQVILDASLAVWNFHYLLRIELLHLQYSKECYFCWASLYAPLGPLSLPKLITYVEKTQESELTADNTQVPLHENSVLSCKNELNSLFSHE